MNQTKIILAVVGVIVVGGLWFFLQTDDANNIQDNAATQADSASQSEESSASFEGVGSFTSLLGLGKNIRCEFAFSDEDGSGSGVGHFAGERMRVDSTQTFEGETTDVHMINDGTNVYTWTVNGKEAFAIKMPVTQMEGSAYAYADMPNEAEQDMISSDQEVSYDCDRWRVDESTFVPPANVEFTDMQAMFEKMMEGMPEGFEMPEGIPMPQ